VGVKEERNTENINNVVKYMYERSCTSVKSVCEERKGFKIRKGVHQILALSPYLFSVVMYAVIKEIQGEVPWCRLFADNIVLVG